MNKTILILGIIFLLVVTSINSSIAINIKNEFIKEIKENNILYVGGNGPGNYSKIQDAINDAVDGDTVFVYDDSSPYYEHLVVNISINLIGEEKNTTIIDGNGVRTILKILTSKVKIINFTLKNGEQSGFAEAIYIYNETTAINNISITDCIIQNCGKGIYGVNISFLKINNCEIFNNIGQCAYIEDSDHIIINSCVLYNNGEILGDYDIRNGGITIWGYEQYCFNISIYDCDIYSNIGMGIDIIQSKDIEVYKNDIYDNTWMGASLMYMSDLKINNNNLKNNNMYGILIEKVDNITIINNNINENGESENYHSGLLLASCSGFISIIENTISSNYAAGIAIGNVSSIEISENIITNNDYEAINLKYSSDNNNISNNTIYDSGVGITIDDSDYNLIFNNIISSNDYSGIRIHSDSSNNIISNNNIDLNNRYGIHLTESNNNFISDNLIESNSYDGIRLDKLENTIINNNIIKNNKIYGIRFFSSNANIIHNNNITQNEIFGIITDEFSFDNLVYHNNFINYENAFDGGNNRWDSDYPSGGNYWFDYNGTDSDGDGIGDLPYNIQGGNSQDNYPFINPNGWTNNTLQGPDLECVGSLRRVSVKPGSIITTRFYVKNIGESNSELDWRISEYPDWGTWTFTPSSGEDLKPEDGIKNIDVNLVVPNEINEKFSGTITLANIQNSNDKCVLEVSFTTTRNKIIIYSLFLRFLERYPLLNLLFQRFLS